MSYTGVYNPASEVGFELAKLFPETVPLKDKLTPEFMRRLLQDVPRQTLAHYSDKVESRIFNSGEYDCLMPSLQASRA